MLRRATIVIVDGDGAEVATWEAALPDDLDAVERLARWQLAARRRGWSLRLRDPDARLVALVRLAGLDPVVTVEPAPERGRS